MSEIVRPTTQSATTTASVVATKPGVVATTRGTVTAARPRTPRNDGISCRAERAAKHGTDLGLCALMLRITPVEADPDRSELRVEGRLAGEASVELLRQELERAARLERPVVLELSGVSFADQEAVTLLAAAARRGIVLVGGSAWLTSLLNGGR